MTKEMGGRRFSDLLTHHFVSAVDLLPVLPKGRATVLDVGARDGHFSKLLTQHFASVTALDVEKPPFDYPGIVPVAGDVTKLDFPANSFDCIFCTEVLEHIPDVGKACREIIRVARHEIVVGVPFEEVIRVGRNTCRACGKVGPPFGHVNSFDERRLLDLFPGFQLISKSFIGTTREATNALSVALMDLAGNPWGTYHVDHHCLYCGASLRPPAAERTLGSKICSALAHKINRLQALWTRPRGKWICGLLSKQRPGNPTVR